MISGVVSASSSNMFLSPLQLEVPRSLGIKTNGLHFPDFCPFQAESLTVTREMGRQQTLTDLQQSVELSLQDLPGVSVLCRDLESQGHALPGETLVQRYQGSVNTGLYQVTGKVLRKIKICSGEQF